MLPLTRSEQLQRLRYGVFDVLVVGGGINGAVSAAALSARGLKVALVESGDFAGETSSNSSCMVWGGIKYLQSLEFGLVRGLCRSRNALMQAYPTQVPEVRYLSALDEEAPYRPLQILAGTWLYWLIGEAFTRKPKYWPKKSLGTAEPILDMSAMRGGVAYSDAYLPDGDAHFVFGFISRAWEKGAIAVNYTRAESGLHLEGVHHTEIHDLVSGDRFAVRSKAIVNAGGPWAGDFNDERKISTQHHLVYSKGIHLIVPQLTDTGRILTFFSGDGRPFFVLPMRDRSCIGTTDTRVTSPHTEVTNDDRDLVLRNINRYLKTKLRRQDIIAERCGVRPLVVASDPGEHLDWTQLSRKHIIESDPKRRVLTIFGGKITDCLNVGEEVCTELEKFGVAGRSDPPPWFGEPPATECDRFLTLLNAHDSELDGERLWRRYGADAFLLLERLEADPDEGREIFPGTGLLECEVHFAAAHQMVVNPHDFFRRRTLLELTRGRETISSSTEAREICQILFGPTAQDHWKAYTA